MMHNVSNCLSQEELKCIYKSMKDFDLHENCQKYNSCPPECNRATYETFSSSSIYPTLGGVFDTLSQNHNLKNLSYDLLRSSVACLNIFYDNIEYTLIEETPAKGFYGLLSNVGG
jgi:hypothetical protein